MGLAMPVPYGDGEIGRSPLFLLGVVSRNIESKEEAVSRFRNHIVWVPKYRYRILVDGIREVTETGIQAICGYAGCEVVELNVQRDHVHLVVMVLPKVSISNLMGRVKGQTSMKLFNQFRELRKKPYWGNHFWAKEYCVDTVGLNAEMIRKYVRYQEKREKQEEQLRLY